MVADSAPNDGRLRVFVIDDNRDCADTLVTLLRILGHDARANYDSESGLDAALNFRPQLILLDLAMPAKDGFAILRDLRNDARFAQVPVVALTGYADNSHRERAAEAGFNAFLVKPCGLDDLRHILQAVEDRDGDRRRAIA